MGTLGWRGLGRHRTDSMEKRKSRESFLSSFLWLRASWNLYLTRVRELYEHRCWVPSAVSQELAVSDQTSLCTSCSWEVCCQCRCPELPPERYSFRSGLGLRIYKHCLGTPHQAICSLTLRNTETSLKPRGVPLTAS